MSENGKPNGKGVVSHVRDLPDKPGDVPGLVVQQDKARATAMTLYQEQGLPFLRSLFTRKQKVSDRLKLDATKVLQQVALPPPTVHIGDVEVTIVVDM